LFDVMFEKQRTRFFVRFGSIVDAVSVAAILDGFGVFHSGKVANRAIKIEKHIIGKASIVYRPEQGFEAIQPNNPKIAEVIANSRLINNRGIAVIATHCESVHCLQRLTFNADKLVSVGKW
jgi:hypothetical protein